ncbi:hypothetical protein MP638_003940 [Amoeboaphelidium occidentale]|nr:hypothetical protein MP638_003940 [Amoeboaphelidium occidentale]
MMMLLQFKNTLRSAGTFISIRTPLGFYHNWSNEEKLKLLNAVKARTKYEVKKETPYRIFLSSVDWTGVLHDLGYEKIMKEKTIRNKFCILYKDLFDDASSDNRKSATCNELNKRKKHKDYETWSDEEIRQLFEQVQKNSLRDMNECKSFRIFMKGVNWDAVTQNMMTDRSVLCYRKKYAALCALNRRYTELAAKDPVGVSTMSVSKNCKNWTQKQKELLLKLGNEHNIRTKNLPRPLCENFSLILGKSYSQTAYRWKREIWPLKQNG